MIPRNLRVKEKRVRKNMNSILLGLRLRFRYSVTLTIGHFTATCTHRRGRAGYCQFRRLSRRNAFASAAAMVTRFPLNFVRFLFCFGLFLKRKHNNHNTVKPHFRWSFDLATYGRFEFRHGLRRTATVFTIPDYSRQRILFVTKPQHLICFNPTDECHWLSNHFRKHPVRDKINDWWERAFIKRNKPGRYLITAQC